MRQSAIALLGELCRSSPTLITPFVAQLLTVLERNFVPAVQGEDLPPPLVANNAVWCLGELAVKVGGDPLAPRIGHIMSALTAMIRSDQTPTTLRQNLAICIGRIGVTNTAQVAGMLPEFFDDFCGCLMSTLGDGVEREHAFSGLVALLHANPAAIASTERSGRKLFLACSVWEDPPPEPLLSSLSAILQAVKDQLGKSLSSGSRQLDARRLANVMDTFRLH